MCYSTLAASALLCACALHYRRPSCAAVSLAQPLIESASKLRHACRVALLVLVAASCCTCTSTGPAAQRDSARFGTARSRIGRSAARRRRCVSKKATPTPTPRSAALDAAGYAYALVRASDGGAVVTLDLDRTQRVRSAVFFYETRAQADAVRKAVMSARPKAAPLALARVPLGEAAALVLAPPAKREGVPGYFCHRLLVEQSRLAAKKITGISDLGDRFLPLFYVDDDTGSREASGGVQAFFDPKAAELVRKEAKRDFTVREADAFVLLRRGGLDELDLVPSALMAADAKGDGLVALDDSAPLEVVLELECDVANSNCVISKIKR